MAYDASRQQLLVFGGCCDSNADPLQDTWMWDGSVWLRLSPTHVPPRTAGPRMAYDGTRNQIVLLDGTQTWAWAGTDWLRSSGGPPVRDDFGIAYDAVRQEVVVFGGHWSTKDGIVYRNDTWTWNGSSWSQQAPTHQPSVRAGMGMVYDAARDEVVLFGGCGSVAGPCQRFNDTWAWDGSDWHQRFPATSPPAQDGPTMAYDPLRTGVGLLAVDSSTWTWDGATWTHREPIDSPPARSAAGMAYDLANGQMVMFGGEEAGPLDDTWLLLGNTWLRVG